MRTLDVALTIIGILIALWLAERLVAAWIAQDEDFRDVEHRERGMVALAKIHRESRRDTQ